jgi:hypothetical protein
MKVVYNDSYGGFYLSDGEISRIREKTGVDFNKHSKMDRHNSELVKIVMELPEEDTSLRIHEFPDLFEDCYMIDEYDGLESVEVDFRKWLQKNIHLEPVEFMEKVKQALLITQEKTI